MGAPETTLALERPSEDMDYCDIKNVLCKKGYTLTRVARELGLAGPQAVQQVCRGRHRSARTEKYISEITGIPLNKLFPQHYR